MEASRGVVREAADGGTASPLGVRQLSLRVRQLSLGFAARLAAATSLLVLVVSGWQSWLLARHDLDHVRGYLGDRGRALAAQLARDSGRSLVSGDLDTLERLADQTRTAGGVVYVRILDRQGLLVAAAGQLPVTTPAAGASAGSVGSDEVWGFDDSITLDGSPASQAALGSVTVGLSLEPLHALRVRRLATAIGFTALSTLFGVLGATFLARTLTGPLRALAAAADRISHGDFGARVTAVTNDEVGRLGASFNAMAVSLARSRATLEENIRELERANHLKSEFLATISHELRTPLNVIIGYTEMLADGEPGSVTEAQAEMLGSIKQYASNQLDLITSVLDFTRLSSGKVSLNVERFGLAPLLAEIQTLHMVRLRDSGVTLSMSVDPAVAELETDRVKLQEILRNLVDNAVKFTAQGRIEVRAQLAEPGWVAIEVADTGSGIAPEDLEAIFDPFHQVGSSSTRSTGGVGLGLSIVHQLAEALGGRVSVTSRLGEGSRFCVAIPCVPEQAEAVPLTDATAALDVAARNTARVTEQARPLRAVPGGANAPRSRRRRVPGTTA